jgi:hypothetical protein
LVAHSWAVTADPAARTAPARAAFLRRFAREVDPDGVLPAAERERRAAQAHRAYMLTLSRKAAEARRKRRNAKRPPLPATDEAGATS